MNDSSKATTSRHFYPAHIRVVNECKQYQSVEEHCRNVAKYASEALSILKLSSISYLAGLLHDMGKYTYTFRDYLEKAVMGEQVVRGSVNHTFAAVIYLLERYHIKEQTDFSMMTCEIIAFAVGSHHGEFDCIDLEKENGFVHRLGKDRNSISYDEAVEEFLESCASEEELDRLFMESVVEIEQIFHVIKKTSESKKRVFTFMVGLLSRLVLSAVIDADRLDTAEFMLNREVRLIHSNPDLWKETYSHFENKMTNLSTDTPINEARAFFSEICFQEGKRFSNGIFRLTLPTGAGKTLASLRYALSKAQTFEKKRIMFVIPLLSIVEQNSAVIREYIGNDRIVLEHHSNFVKESNDEEELDEYELLTETWDSPIIITTLVQLLNTLFSGKTSSIRRMNSLIDSVIIIDEIQSLPKKILYMFNVAMNFLAYICGATVVLSSATQPVLDSTEIPICFSDSRDIIPFDPVRNAVFKRTRIINCTSPYGMSVEELGDFCTEKFEDVKSLLVICNTKSSATKGFEQIKQNNRDAQVFHLSASMCMKHRINTLQKIQECLEQKEKVICVSTQLVEAGVDFSFQRVVRVLAGLDNVAQAAGRCNRHGDFGNLCDVYIVNLKSNEENLKMLKDIYASQRSTGTFLRVFERNPQNYDEDLISNKSVEKYYYYLFQDPDICGQFEFKKIDNNGDERRLFRLLSDNSELIIGNANNRYFLTQSFKTAGKLFEVFEENTTDILVPYDDRARQLISDLMSEKAKWNQAFVMNLVEQTKPYLIRIFEYQKKRLLEDGMLYEDPSKHFMILNELCYSSDSGLKRGDVFL